VRKLGIAVLVLIVLLVAAVLIIPHLVDVNQYHSRIQAELQKRLGRPVTLGDMRLSLFPPSFQVQNVTIGEDPRFSFNQSRPFAQAEKLAVSVELMPLFHKEIQVKSLELVRPHIELVRDAAGNWNFATLGQEPKPSAPEEAAKKTTTPQPQQPAPAQPAQQPEKQPAGQLSLANLAITDGQVAITDQQKHQSRAVYDHIDLNVSDFAPNQQFNLKAAAHLPGAGKQAIFLQGKGGPLRQADMLNTPFAGTLKLDQVSLSAIEAFLNSQALKGIESVISGETSIHNSNSKLTAAGTLKLDNPKIRKVDVGYPITLDYDVTDDLTNDVIDIRKGNLKLGSTPVTVTGTMNAKPTPAQVDMKLTASNASIQEAARLASAFGVAFGEGMDVKGTVNANIQARGAADKPAMNGQLSARNLNISGKGIPQPVSVPSIDLALTPTTVRSNNFSATTGSTTVNMNFGLTNYTGPKSTIDAMLRAPNAKIAEILNMGKAAGVAALDGISGDGLLNLDVHAQGPLKNTSAMTFNGTGKIQNASLKLPSLTKPVQIKNSDIQFSQNSANLRNLAASVGQTNATGTVTLRNFEAPQVQFTLNADKVDIAELQQLTNAQPAPQKKAAVDRDFWQLVPRAEAQQTQPATPAQPGMIQKMTGNGAVSVGTIVYNDLVLNNAHANVTLDHGLIKLNPVTSDLYNGKTNGNITIDMRPAQPVYTVNMKTDKVDANKLISSVSDLKQTLYGMLTSNVNASFSSTSADAIARSLNGTLGLNLVNGKLMNLDLLHELAAVNKFAGNAVPAPQGFTNIVSLTGNFDVKNGVAQTNNLKAAIDGGTLAAAGTANLADQSLHMRVTAVLNKALSQQVGGSQIGGYMSTALANNQGELVLPVIVTGTFKHPSVAPDLEQIAQMKLHNLVPNTNNPAQLASGILGQVLGHKGNTGGNQQQNTINGILGALKGQQQQQQPAQRQAQPAQQGQPAQEGQPAQAQGQPQSQASPSPTQQSPQNAVGDLLNQVLNKKKASPTPTPQR
jgi:AsmA protein